MDAKNMTDSEVMVASVLSPMDTLTDDERLQVMARYCRDCGSEDPRCQCWNDE